jgi:hypothetical protein
MGVFPEPVRTENLLKYNFNYYYHYPVRPLPIFCTSTLYTASSPALLLRPYA